MGEFPARIVAQDFVTPPEFADWQLAGNGAGRIGGARFALEALVGDSLRESDGTRGASAPPIAGGTRLTNLYEQVPLRVMSLNLGPTEPTLVYLLNPTNGLMDGDAHRIEIQAAPGTRSVVTGQSATRIHPCLNGFCTQQWKLAVADDAILVVLPGPAIPFAGCRFFQHVEIDLGKNAQLIWSDIWFAGRYARHDASERFRFDRIVQETLIRREGQLVFRDRFGWHGPWSDETARWHFGAAPAAGMLFATGSHPSEELAIIGGSRVGAFTTAAGDTCCRCTGTAGAVIQAVVGTSLRLASAMTEGSAHQPWLVGGNHLARTHWFDVI